MSHARGEKIGTPQDPERFFKDGYCIFPHVLGATALDELRAYSEAAIAAAPKANFGPAGGMVTPELRHPATVNLINHPEARQAFAQLGYTHPKLHSYYISTKQPGAEGLLWHSDIFYPNTSSNPSEVFLIYYLQDTDPANGCLRVVPGSHLWAIKDRQLTTDARTRQDEVDVPVAAGDLFIGDRRLLHATHANRSNSTRTCFTIAYAPDFAALPEPLQAFIVQHPSLPPAGWWDSPQAETLNPRLREILPIYKGTAEPITLLTGH